MKPVAPGSGRGSSPATNILGSIALIQAALPHLRAQGGGRILQLASLAGGRAFPGLTLCNASKFLMVGFCEALRDEVSSCGIGVTLVEPGSARTQFGARLRRYAQPIAAYAGTPADQMRVQVRSGSTADRLGDSAKTAAAMIAAAEAPEAPRLLGFRIVEVERLLQRPDPSIVCPHGGRRRSLNDRRQFRSAQSKRSCPLLRFAAAAR